jgi:hypothetical protein
VAKSQSLTLADNSVKSIAEFTPQDLNPFGYMTYRLYREGFMNAVSVGFQPTEYTMAADRKWGINYIKQSLLEYSAVPVPANPDALAVARSKGINLLPMKEWAEHLLDEKTLSDDERRRMETVRSVAALTGRSLFMDLGDIKMAEKDKETPPTSAVKKVERWEDKDGNIFATEAEAKASSEFETHVTDVIKSLQQLATLVKGGKKLKAEAAALFKSVVDEIVPKSEEPEPKPAEEEEVAVETEEGEEEGIELSEEDEEKIASAVRSAVEAEINKRTGRVD